jgi:hypothetical protein
MGESMGLTMPFYPFDDDNHIELFWHQFQNHNTTITPCPTLTKLALFDINGNTIIPGLTWGAYGGENIMGKWIYEL